MNDRPDRGQDERHADAFREGLCATCRHRREIRSDRGSLFVFCDRSRTQPQFPRYPPLPVVACRGYEDRETDPR